MTLIPYAGRDPTEMPFEGMRDLSKFYRSLRPRRRKDRKARGDVALFDPSLPQPKTPWRILLRQIAIKHNVPEVDILGTALDRKATAARQHLMWLLRTELCLGYTAIGHLLGRDHTTGIAGFRAHQARIDRGEVK